MSQARFDLHGDIAVITLDNPPVNALSHAHRTSIVAHLRAAEANPAVRAVVLIGAGDAFCGGAEIREFNTPAALAEPITRQVAEAAEALAKPVIAAIHKVAMGGGLELALGCHYRVASAGAAIALPEVKLGLLPGAGGTQRLPRAIGAQAALEMIVSGDPRRSETLAPLGLFERIIEGDLLTGAIAFAREVANQGLPLRRLRDEPVPGDDLPGLIARTRTQVARDWRGFPAPARCVDAVEAAIVQPFDDGIRFERRTFLELVETPESRALRHSFFAERAAGKVAGIGPDVKPRKIESVAIVGAGTMGSGIAIAMANAGLRTILLDTTPEAIQRAGAHIEKTWSSAVARGRLDQASFERRMALVETSTDMSRLAEADLVIEAVYEDLEVKHAVFARIEAAARPDAILATNTSTLDVDAIAARTRDPSRVLGLHFFSPANVMRLLEIVRGRATSPETLATGMALGRRLRKVGVVCGVCDGFIGNRMLEEYLRQAYALVDEGATPRAVDEALEAWGFAMGPFRMMDLVGQDIGRAIRKRITAEHPDKTYPAWPDRLCEAGRFGQKTGAGIYRYESGRRDALPDPEADRIIAESVRVQGIAQRTISAEEIVERCVLALANEGARILDEGIAARASDIDIVYLTGYGFPRYRGGPMFFADELGLAKVAARLASYDGVHFGKALAPAPLLERLAAEGRRFNG
jgi:3-hydroxyacyl-CoA dehydrogenase